MVQEVLTRLRGVGVLIISLSALASTWFVRQSGWTPEISWTDYRPLALDIAASLLDNITAAPAGPFLASTTLAARPTTTTVPHVSRGFIGCVAAGLKRDGYADSAYMGAAIKRLRKLGNFDPVYLYHVDGELGRPEIELLLSVENVVVKDLVTLVDAQDRQAVGNDLHRYRGFDCKILALLHTPLEKTMLIDSDTVFFTNPIKLWEHPTVLSTGTMFFKDRKVNDAANPSPPGNIKCDRIINFIAQKRRGGFFENVYPQKLRTTHAGFCEGVTKHEMCSSLVVLDKSHPTGVKTLEMLKMLHTGYIMSNDDVKSWSWGDKEYYWIACELTGEACGWSERGRPMHLFNTDESGGRPAKTGCAVQVSPMGDGSELLHGNLDNMCPLMTRMLNGVNNWNPNNTDEAAPGQPPAIDTGAGVRKLKLAEQSAIGKYWSDVETLNKKWHEKQR